MLKKVNEKKVLHKVKKQWVVLGTALFALGTAGAYSESVHADTIGDNHSSSLVASSAATTTSNSADTNSSAATNSKDASATSSGATSNSSTVTSGSTSVSQSATTTLQTENSSQSTANAAVDDDGLSLRVGDDTSVTDSNATVGSRPASSTATSVALVDSEPYYNGSLSAPGTYSYSDNSILITMSVSGSDYATYHKAVNDGYTIQVANSNGVPPFTGINRLVQTVTLSNGSSSQLSVSGSDINKYVSFTSNSAYNASDQNINVSNPDGSGSTASSISLITVSGGPVDSKINNQYYNGDSVTWTLYTDSNSDYKEQGVNIKAYVGSIMTVTPMQIQYVDGSGNTIKDSQWITGKNIYPGTTYDGLNIPKIDGYSYKGTTYNGASAINLKNVDNNYVLYGTFNNYNIPDKNGNIDPIVLTLTYNKLPSETVNVNYYDVDSGSSNAISGVSNASFSGYAGDSINYSAQSIVDSLTREGYELTSSSPSASNSITISSDANSNTYNYNFTHKKVTYDGSSYPYPSGLSQADLTKTFTRTIDFVYSNGSGSYNIISSASQNVTYNRSATYDEVTKSVVSYGDWSSTASEFPEYAAPSFNGYINPNPSSIATQSVGPNNDSSTSTSIVYKVQQFNGSVSFLDTNNSNSLITTGSFSGPVGATVNYSSTIDSLSSLGYQLISDSPSVSFAVKSSDNNYAFNFIHKKDTYDASSTSYPTNLSKNDFTKSFTRTINFVDASDASKSVSDPVTQTVTYDRSGVYDEVTKSTSYGAWNASDGNSSFSEYAATSVAGYENPQPASAAAQLINAPDASGSDATPQSSSVTIKYTKSSAAIFNGTVAFLDIDNNNNSLATGSFNGTIGATINYSSTVDSLSNKGYQLTNDSPSVSFVVKSSDNNYVFKLAHKKDNYDASSTSYPTSLSRDDFTKSFTRTINFVDSADPSKSVSNPVIQIVTYNRSGVYDEVTKVTSYSDWTTDNSSFAKQTAPSVTGYENPQPASAAAQSVNAPDASGSDATPQFSSVDIKYTKTFNGFVTFLDVDNNNSEVASGSFSGAVGTPVNYSSTVDSLSNQGYQLTSDAPATSFVVNSSNNSYVFKLTHKKVNYDASSTSYPAGLSNDDFTKSFTRTINFVDASDASKSVSDPVTQTVTYNRSGVYDEVTKETSYGNWTTDNSSFAEQTAPSVAGYEKPQPASAAAQSVNAPDANGSDETPQSSSVTIKYNANFSGNVSFVDIDNHNSEVASGSFSGDVGTPVNYSSTVDSLSNGGYQLTSDSPATSFAVNSSNNSYVFKLTHKKVNYDASSTSYPAGLSNADFTKSFTRTVNFVDAADPAKPVSEPVTQTVTYDRSGVYDEVTKVTSFGNWTTDNSSFAEQAATSVAGYENPQPASAATQVVSSPDANGSDATPQSSSVTIKYNANLSGNVSFVDIDNHNSQVASDSFNGTVGTLVNYSSTVASLNNQGYQLTSDSPATSFAVNSSNNDYVFKLVHKEANYDASSTSYPNELSNADFTKSFTRTINFVDADDASKSVSDPVTQTVTYNRSGVYDEVTKATSYGDWSTDDSSFAEQSAPSVAGYENPQPASAATQVVSSPDANGSDETPKSNSVTIKYTKSSAAPAPTEFSGSVAFLDVDRNNSQVANGRFSGRAGENVNYSSFVASLGSQGYQLTSDSPATSFAVNSSNNNYVFKLAHKKVNYDASSTSYPAGLSKNNFNQSVTRTINFVDANTKQPISSAVTQTVSYSRSAVYDEVTKSTSYGAWSTSDSTFADYNAPSVSGYNDPQPTSVAAQSVAAPTSDGSYATAFSASIEYTKNASSAASFTPFIFYSTASSAVSSTAVSSSATPSSTSAIKMYNDKTQLVKKDGKILIFIEPKYAPNAGNGSLSNQYVINRKLSNGEVSHQQEITLDQYNSMLTASWKQPYTPKSLNEAYLRRHSDNNIMKNQAYKTTFDANVITQGDYVLIDTSLDHNGFSNPADRRLVVVVYNKPAKHSDSNKKHANKRKSQKKAKHAHKHVKKTEHHVTKHTHHVKYDRKSKK